MSADRLSARTLALIVCVGTIVLAMAHFSKGSAGWIGGATVTYSADNDQTAAWTKTLTTSNSTVAWYSRLEFSSGGYSGRATVTWQLQQKTGVSTWTNVNAANTLSSIVLSGNAQNIYATSDGVYGADNHNWGTDVAAAGTYRVLVTVESHNG